MEKTEIIQYASVYLLSIVKLVLGSVPLAIAYIKLSKLSFITCMILCCLGGFTGTVIFTNLGQKLWHWLATFSWYQAYQSRNKATIKARKRIISIKHRYGLLGIAFLSPILLSIPGGCLLAARFYHNKWNIYAYMFISILVWVWGSGSILYWIF